MRLLFHLLQPNSYPSPGLSVSPGETDPRQIGRIGEAIVPDDAGAEPLGNDIGRGAADKMLQCRDGSAGVAVPGP